MESQDHHEKFEAVKQCGRILRLGKEVSPFYRLGLWGCGVTPTEDSDLCLSRKKKYTKGERIATGYSTPQ